MCNAWGLGEVDSQRLNFATLVVAKPARGVGVIDK